MIAMNYKKPDGKAVTIAGEDLNALQQRYWKDQCPQPGTLVTQQQQPQQQTFTPPREGLPIPVMNFGPEDDTPKPTANQERQRPNDASTPLPLPKMQF